MSRAITEQAADWAIRQSDDALSEAEQHALDTWLAQDAAHRRAFEKARSIMGDARSALRLDPDFTKRLLRESEKSRWPTAVIVAAILIATSLFFAADGPLRLQADYVSAAHETPTVTLPDNSRVTLNGDSAIEDVFDGRTRTVRLLKGEAYFEVARDPARPFVVIAGNGRIEARGTAFDVNLVSGTVDVTVTEHTVAVTGAESGKPVLVPSGSRLSYDAAGTLGKIAQVPPGFEAPWRSGRLIFDDRPLATVAEEIFRHLPGKVLVADDGIARRRISGSFDLSDPDAVLRSFGTAFNLHLVRVGPFLTVIY